MPKSKKRKQKIKSFGFSLNNFALVLVTILAIFISLFTVYKFIASQFKPVLETATSETKKIPLSVERELKKQSSVSASFRVPILMYHYVEYVQDKKDTIRQSLNINPNVFEQQLKTLLDAGYTFITAKDLGKVLDGKANLPPKPVLLTFDDGHWDLDTVVLPILEKYHAKATAYIIPGFLGGSDFLTKNQLKEVIDSKLVEIGAHTVHHISLRRKFYPIAQYEIKQSKLILEKDYNISVVSFAYPNGDFDSQAIKIVKDVNFSTAVSTIPGNIQTDNNRFFLFRLRPGYRIGQDLIDYISQPTLKNY